MSSKSKDKTAVEGKETVKVIKTTCSYSSFPMSRFKGTVYQFLSFVAMLRAQTVDHGFVLHFPIYDF